jgi:hypothetical protein
MLRVYCGHQTVPLSDAAAAGNVAGDRGLCRHADDTKRCGVRRFAVLRGDGPGPELVLGLLGRRP